MNEGTGIPLHPRAKHDAIDHGEDADIETETERQRKHRREGKAGLAGDGPERVAKTLAHMNEDKRSGRLLHYLRRVMIGRSDRQFRDPPV